MNANTKNAIVSIATGLAAYIPVCYAVDNTLSEIDEIHAEETGKETKGIKTLSNSAVAVTAGWAAAIVTWIMVGGIVKK
jgi:hypothetical protein